jgi:hypothetical protein
MSNIHLCQNSTHTEAEPTLASSSSSSNIVSLHHCRNCGNGVCDECSRTRKPVPIRGWDQPVRVCNKCRDLPSPWNKILLFCFCGIFEFSNYFSTQENRSKSYQSTRAPQSCFLNTMQIILIIEAWSFWMLFRIFASKWFFILKCI